MYDTMFKTFADQMAPFNKVAEINKKTAEKLVEIQSAYVTELYNAGVAQAKALTGAKEPKDAIELQVAFFKEMEAKLTSVAEQEFTTLTGARDELTSVFEETLETLAKTDYLKEMASFDLASVMPSVLEKKAKTTRKAAAPKSEAAA